MIILTAAEANEVRGLTALGHALAPVPLLSGEFVVPNQVVSDDYHLIRKAYIEANGTVVDDSEIKPEDYETNLGKISANYYSKDWPVGEKVVVVP